MKALKSKLGKLSNSYWVKSGKYSLLTKISDAALGLFPYMLLIRIIEDKNEFGIWVLFVTVSATFESLRNAFIYNPMVRFLNINENSMHGQITVASLVQNLLFTVVTSSLLVGLAQPVALYWDAGPIVPLIYVFAGTNIAYLLLSHFLYIQQANLEFKGAFYIAFIRKGLFFLYVALLYFGVFEINLINLAIAQGIIVVLCIPVGYLFSRRFMVLEFKSTKKWLSELLNFGKFTITSNFSSVLFNSIDSWMLANLLNPAAVALYNPAIRITKLVEIPLGTLTSISYPKITKSIKEQGEGVAKGLYEKTVAAILAIMIPTVILGILLAKPIILFIADKNYLGTVPILQVAILYGLIIPFNRQFGVTVNALGRANVNLAFVVTNALVNIVTNYVFISFYGVIGAAYGTLVAYITSLTYSQLYLRKAIGVSFFQVLRNTLNYYTLPYKFFVKKA